MNRIFLSERQAIVTGGARGIGRAITERLLDSGAAVVIWDVDKDRTEQTVEELTSAGTVHAVQVDQTDPAQVARAFEATLERVSHIDILVNNAGIAGPTIPLWEYPIDDWRRVVDVDLNGIFYCCRAIVPHMLERGYGRIVNVASVAGKEGNPNASAYSAAKAGVIALTKSLGKELAEHDIAVNCITPAVAKTEILEQFDASHVDYMLSRIPRKRLLELHEVAAMVAWLVSQENSFTTAAVFDLTGGRATY